MGLSGTRLSEAGVVDRFVQMGLSGTRLSEAGVVDRFVQMGLSGTRLSEAGVVDRFVETGLPGTRLSEAGDVCADGPQRPALCSMCLTCIRLLDEPSRLDSSPEFWAGLGGSQQAVDEETLP